MVLQEFKNRIERVELFTAFGAIACSALMCAPFVARAHEVDQHIGGYSSTDGESRVMAKFSGRGDGPALNQGEVLPALTISAQAEQIRLKDKYMDINFPEGERTDRAFGIDGILTISKRTEVSFGGSVAGDTVTKISSGRLSMGQWMMGDQLRLGVSGSSTVTNRPQDSYLDYDSTTIQVLPHVVSNVVGINLKAILNPTTTVTGDYAVAKSTDRPLLRSWAVGLRQFIDACKCAIHSDAGRVINLGQLDTTMTAGELTGSQWSVAYLQALWQDAHARLAYRYAREDEFTRAYGDHLVFGADSYVAALSQEIRKARIGGEERPLLVDIAATRYIHNKAGSATTVEFGGSVKF